MSTFSIVVLLVWIAVLELRLWWVRASIRNARQVAAFAVEVEPCPKGIGAHRWGMPNARQVARCIECCRVMLEVE